MTFLPEPALGGLLGMEQATARQRVSDSQDAQGLGAAESRGAAGAQGLGRRRSNEVAETEWKFKVQGFLASGTR